MCYFEACCEQQVLSSIISLTAWQGCSDLKTDYIKAAARKVEQHKVVVYRKKKVDDPPPPPHSTKFVNQ